MTAGLAAAGVLTSGATAAAYRFEVVRQTVSLAGLNRPLRIAWLCDLHYGQYIGAGSVEHWVDATLRERPDVIALGGDIVDSHAGNRLEPLLSAIGRLAAPLGVFAVWGNHDRRRFPDIRVFERSLQDRGVQVLVNRGLALRDDLYLAGIDDFRTGEPDVTAALRGAPAAGARLLLSHNPDALPTVPAQQVGLTLCGHTHGGQVRLPIIGALVTSSRYGQRFAQGWVKGPARGYVSRGLGVSMLPIRVDCPAELTIMDLVPETASVDEASNPS